MMTDNEDERIADARKLVHWAIEGLMQLPASQNLLADTADLLDCITGAWASYRDLSSILPPAGESIYFAFGAAIRILAPAVAPTIAEDTLAFGLGAASGLLFCPDDGFHIDRHATAKLLSADITKLRFKRLLSERGHPLTRAVRIGCARSELPPTLLLQ